MEAVKGEQNTLKDLKAWVNNKSRNVFVDCGGKLYLSVAQQCLARLFNKHYQENGKHNISKWTVPILHEDGGVIQPYSDRLSQHICSRRQIVWSATESAKPSAADDSGMDRSIHFISLYTPAHRQQGQSKDANTGAQLLWNLVLHTDETFRTFIVQMKDTVKLINLLIGPGLSVNESTLFKCPTVRVKFCIHLGWDRWHCHSNSAAFLPMRH